MAVARFCLGLVIVGAIMAASGAPWWSLLLAFFALCALDGIIATLKILKLLGEAIHAQSVILNALAEQAAQPAVVHVDPEAVAAHLAAHVEAITRRRQAPLN